MSNIDCALHITLFVLTDLRVRIQSRCAIAMVHKCVYVYVKPQLTRKFVNSVTLFIFYLLFEVDRKKSCGYNKLQYGNVLAMNLTI